MKEGIFDKIKSIKIYVKTLMKRRHPLPERMGRAKLRRGGLLRLRRSWGMGMGWVAGCPL
jgi:hypothetical protein